MKETVENVMRMDSLDELKAMIIAVVGSLTAFWGWKGWLCIGWIVCMMLDWITGNLEAKGNGTWSSKAARQGILHKFGMIVIVMMSCIADLLLGLATDSMGEMIPFRYPGILCPVVMLWYIVTELGSIAENALAMGAPVPAWLLKALAVAKDATDKAGDSIVPTPEANGDDDHG